MPPPLRLPAWTMAVASLAAFIAIQRATPESSGQARMVCSGDVAGPLLIGLLVAVPVVVWLQRWVAAGLAVLAATYWSFGYADSPTFRWWAWPAVFGYCAFALLMPLGRTGDPRSLATPERHEVPTRPTELPRVRPWWWLVAAITGLAAAAAGSIALAVVLEVDRSADRTRIGSGSGLVFVAAVLGSVALGFAGHAREHNRAARRLFTTPQPVRRYRQVGVDAGRVAVLDVPDPVWIPVRAEPGEGSIGHARVLGDPVPGCWFAVEVNGRQLVPTGPARALPLLEQLPFGELPDRDPDIWDEVEEPVPDHLLADADRRPAAEDIRTHAMLAGTSGWFYLGFGLFLPTQLLRPLFHVQGWIVVAVVTASLALLLEVAWRRGLIATRIRWNDGGIVIRNGAQAPVRLAWSEVTDISRHDRQVWLDAGDETYTMRGRAWFGRDRDRLWAALTDTWRRARTSTSTVDLPPAGPTGRPPTLYALWLGASAVIGAFGVWATGLPTS